MSIRTFDPKEPEVFKPALCAAGCGKPYATICKPCNLAYCADHLKPETHVCDSKAGHIVHPPQEFELSLLDLPQCWDPSPKGCFATHPESGEVCQLPADGHGAHMRAHPNGKELESWFLVTG